MKPETKVWNHFKKAWPWRCYRHDPDGGHNSGLPDVGFVGRTGRRGLLELKRPDKVVLRPSQKLWHEADMEGGGHSCVVTCKQDGRTVYWNVYRITDRQELMLYGEQWVPAKVMIGYVGMLCRVEV